VKNRNQVAQAYTELLEKYERVQHGYDQGVLEGTRHTHVYIRAYLTGEIQREAPNYQAYLIEWLNPRLSRLGETQHRQLMEMKGLTEAEAEFKDELTDVTNQAEAALTNQTVEEVEAQQERKARREHPYILRADALDDDLQMEDE